MGTVPVPYSPVAGDDATQPRVLTWADSCAYLLGNATSGGSRRPFCVMRQTVAQSIANGGTGVALTFDVEDVDYDNGHSLVTNTSRYTAATAGWHWLFATVSFATNTAGDRIAWFKINGTTDVLAAGSDVAPVPNADPLTASFGRMVFLNVGDFVEVFVLQNSGAAVNTSVATTRGQMSSLCVELRSN